MRGDFTSGSIRGQGRPPLDPVKVITHGDGSGDRGQGCFEEKCRWKALSGAWWGSGVQRL